MMEKLKAQIVKAEGGPKGVGQLLLEICKKEPAAVEIVEQDLENSDMSIEKCFLKMQNAARKKQKEGCYYMPPEEAEAIIREFYGIQGLAKEDREEKAGEAEDSSSGILDIADLMDL